MVHALARVLLTCTVLLGAVSHEHANADSTPLTPAALGDPQQVIPYIIDRDFAKRYVQLELPAFSIDLPIWREVRPVLVIRFGQGFEFQFRGPDDEILEILHFYEVDIDPGPADARFEVLERFLMRGDTPTAAWRGENVEVHQIRRWMDGEVPVLDITASYDEPELGQTLLLTRGYPHPVQRRGVRIISRIPVAGRDIANPDDLADTFSAKVVKSLRFVP
ncbi:MAG: hypothetical protein AAFV19_08675 [Pseudomonadota bacterium]